MIASRCSEDIITHKTLQKIGDSVKTTCSVKTEHVLPQLEERTSWAARGTGRPIVKHWENKNNKTGVRLTQQNKMDRNKNGKALVLRKVWHSLRQDSKPDGGPRFIHTRAPSSVKCARRKPDYKAPCRWKTVQTQLNRLIPVMRHQCAWAKTYAILPNEPDSKQYSRACAVKQPH